MGWGHPGVHREEGWVWARGAQGSTGRRGWAWAGGAQWLVWLDRLPGAETRPLLLDRVRGLGLASGCVDFYGSPGRRGPRAMEEQTVRSVDSGTPGRRRRGQVMPRITGCFYLHHQA